VFTREDALRADEGWLRDQGIGVYARDVTWKGARLDFIALVRCAECGGGSIIAGYAVAAPGTLIPGPEALRRALTAWSSSRMVTPDRHRVSVLDVSPGGRVTCTVQQPAGEAD
jgi:hypothetical protein